jgi:acetamidase/formamidase
MSGDGPTGGQPAPTSIHQVVNRTQLNWSNERPPVVTVKSGAELTLNVPDASGGQIDAASQVDAIANLDFERVNPTCGPIFVEGAMPGDVLAVEIARMEMSTYGWTAIIPGFGLLADQFPRPWLHVWSLNGGRAAFRDGIFVHLQPFCGVIGLAPAEPGIHSVIPPRRVGGNLDVKQLGEGATLYLPVEVEGALLGIGDTHAAQGDGEVCGTAIESPAEVTVRLKVLKDREIDAPEFDVTRPLERPSAAKAGYHATTGVAPDLMAATRQAIERMVVYLGHRLRLTDEEAYALCSVAVDLKISEVVDAPNWVVSAFLPNDLFL